PTMAGVLDAATRRAWATAQGWAPRTLSPSQLELVAVMAEHIIPRTDTPGARAAGVHRFVDTLLSDHYPTAERDRFLAGLADVDARARSQQGKAFLACAPAQQITLLTELDEAAYPVSGAGAPPPETWFFRRMKELTLVGYYTSQVGGGRDGGNRKDSIAEHKPSWELPLRAARLSVGTKGAEEYPIQARTGQFRESNKHFFLKDAKNPYVEDKPFTWIQGDQVGGKSLIWGRQVYRWSDLDFEANLRDGHGVDWPIRYADVAPWYSYVERFIGVSGETLGRPQLPDGEF